MHVFLLEQSNILSEFKSVILKLTILLVSFFTEFNFSIFCSLLHKQHFTFNLSNLISDSTFQLINIFTFLIRCRQLKIFFSCLFSLPALHLLLKQINTLHIFNCSVFSEIKSVSVIKFIGIKINVYKYLSKLKSVILI